MRGEVLHYDEAQGFGFITGADGGRYTFAREAMRRAGRIAQGDTVEFQPSGSQALDVLLIRAQLGETLRPQAPTEPAAHTPHFGRAASPVAVGPVPVGPAALGTTPAAAGDHGLWAHFWRTLTVNYANFRGRAPRKEYWGFVLFYTILFSVAVGVAISLDGSGNIYSDGQYVPVYTIGAIGILFLLAIVPGLALTVRRFHDIGLSGWFVLLAFALSIVGIGTLVVFVVSLIPSQKHTNRWGLAPDGIRA